MFGVGSLGALSASGASLEVHQLPSDRLGSCGFVHFPFQNLVFFRGNLKNPKNINNKEYLRKIFLK